MAVSRSILLVAVSATAAMACEDNPQFDQVACTLHAFTLEHLNDCLRKPASR